MSLDSRPIEMSMTEAERLQRVERMVKALREGKSDDFDMVAVIEALAKFSGSNGNGSTKNKVIWLTAAFSICGLAGSYLAVQVIEQGQAIAALKSEVQQCIKVQP